MILKRILLATKQNILRNALTSIVAISIITLLFAFFNAILFLNLLQKSALGLVNEKLDLAITFTKEISEDDLVKLRSDLLATFPEIHDITFVSSEEAFENFITNFGDSNPELAKWLKENTAASPLPSTLVISVEADLHTEVLKFLTQSEFAKSLNLDSPSTKNLGSESANKIIALDHSVSRLSFLSALLFAALATVVILAVLRLAILARRKEIAIMRLTGATREFIRLPFLLEGTFFALLASILGILIFVAILGEVDAVALSGGVYGGFGELVALAKNSFFGSFAFILSWEILAGITIGIIASTIATQKYLGKELILD